MCHRIFSTCHIWHQSSDRLWELQQHPTCGAQSNSTAFCHKNDESTGSGGPWGVCVRAGRALAGETLECDSDDWGVPVSTESLRGAGTGHRWRAAGCHQVISRGHFLVLAWVGYLHNLGSHTETWSLRIFCITILEQTPDCLLPTLDWPLLVAEQRELDLSRKKQKTLGLSQVPVGLLST